MRILFVAPYVPSLIRVRPFNFIRFLAQMGHQITLAALGTDGAEVDTEAKAALTDYCAAIHIVPHSKHQAAVSCALRLATPMPLWAAYCQSPAMERALKQILREETFDVAHVEHLRAAHFAPALRQATGGRLPLVFDSVDCITELQSQMMRAPDRGAAGRALSWEEHNKLKRYEPALAAQFDRILITSETDADCLRELAAARGLSLPIHVIANGVDLEYFRPHPEIAPRAGNIVFTGKMSYAANRDAALYFCREVYPAIRKAHPRATLTVAGSGPTADLTSLAAQPNSGVEVTGRVPDLRPYLAQASVAVCPLRVGVGIQNKVLEAMAMGKGMVATPLACRPLQESALGESLYVADKAAEFVSQTLHLLEHPDETGRLGRHARSYVEARHDWRHIACQVTGIYEEAIVAVKGRTT